MKSLIILLVVFVFALVIGCTAAEQQMQPAPVQQTPPGDPPGTVATVTPEPTSTPFRFAYKTVNGEIIPYVYERAGEYYLQPESFVCTESNPPGIMFYNKSDPDPKNIRPAAWCER